ncbi:hypothetical protein D7V91_15685 [bacterium 1xD42-67]|nr:hypothetical protein D7V91_15685 [bacterium 1xD42-67]
MTDGIIKGTGNSRYLKSVANVMSLYPEYTDFLRALAEGTFPVDLYGINAGGWQVRGNDINKASLLTDAVETAIWGSAANRTVSQALQQLRNLISGLSNDMRVRVIDTWGSYIGDGGKRRSLTFPFTPHFLFVLGTSGAYALFIRDADIYTTNNDSHISYVKVIWSDRSVEWVGNYSTSHLIGCNIANQKYYYYAVGY